MKKLLLCAVLSWAAWSAGAAGIPTIYLIGDSTCATKKLDGENPERGWGHMFPALVDDALRVENHATNGRSTKSFRDEGRWAAVYDKLAEGDYVFIQFGHNDEKINDSTRYSSPDRYAENLRRYVRETREKGARPLLLTPIVRRNWVEGRLVDTHDGYPAAMKRVAAEEQVPLIDMEAITREWLNGVGEEPSKAYYMWVEPGTCPLHPKGRQDNTHLNVKGAHEVARMVAREVQTMLPEVGRHIQFPDFVVAKDGSGDFFTVQEAVNALPDFSREEIWLLVREGVYYEKISIPASKRTVRMTGEGAERSVVSFDGYAKRPDACGREMGTSGSSTVYFGGDDWRIEKMGFANTAGPVGQAVAVQCLGDRIRFVGCRFLGDQDTLYLYGRGNRDGDTPGDNCSYEFVDCYVEGTTDFIFGSAAAEFRNCEIRSKADSYITAASTWKGQKRGFVFRRCRLTAAEGVRSCYLGRPWRNHARTCFVECEMGAHIRPEGWHNWSKPEAEKCAFYGEYGSTGPGAGAAGRVKWAKKLSAREVGKL